MGSAAAPVVVARVQPARGRAHAEGVEEVAAREQAVHEVRFSGPREIEPCAAPGHRTLCEFPLAIAKLLPDRIGQRILLRPDEHLHQSLGRSHGQGPQQQRVEDREHGRGGADAEHQRQHRDSGNDRRCA
jgi:hypothetical protein